MLAEVGVPESLSLAKDMANLESLIHPLQAFETEVDMPIQLDVEKPDCPTPPQKPISSKPPEKDLEDDIEPPTQPLDLNSLLPSSPLPGHERTSHKRDLPRHCLSDEEIQKLLVLRVSSSFCLLSHLLTVHQRRLGYVVLGKPPTARECLNE